MYLDSLLGWNSLCPPEARKGKSQLKKVKSHCLILITHSCFTDICFVALTEFHFFFGRVNDSWGFFVLMKVYRITVRVTTCFCSQTVGFTIWPKLKVRREDSHAVEQYVWLLSWCTTVWEKNNDYLSFIFISKKISLKTLFYFCP